MEFEPMIVRTLIPALLVAFATSVLAQDRPEILIEQLPVGELMFVTGRSPGQVGTIMDLGQTITPFEGNHPEYIPDRKAILSIRGLAVVFRALPAQASEEVNTGGRDVQWASLSPVSAELLFARGTDIFVDDGTEFKRLASGRSPRWSPDGRQIVFEYYRLDRRPQIYAMDADGQNLVNLSDNNRFNVTPCWSPDGKKIAFVSLSVNGKSNIFLMNSDGTDQSNISHGTLRDSEPTWSPDGNWIAFCRTATKLPATITTDIWIMKSDGTEQQQVTKNNVGFSSYQPHWFMPE